MAQLAKPKVETVGTFSGQLMADNLIIVVPVSLSGSTH